MCHHQPQCPAAEAVDREAARVLVSYPEQGWSQLCNGVILFDDTGELLPAPTPHAAMAIAPHRGPALHNMSVLLPSHYPR